MSCNQWHKINYFTIACRRLKRKGLRVSFIFDIYIYINDLCDDLSGESFLFADDSSIFHNVNNNMTHCMRALNLSINGQFSG